MRIAILCHTPVAKLYTANLLTRGHQILQWGGGLLHAHAIKEFLECDGCLLLGTDPQFLEIADHMEASGKPIWHDLAEIPK